MDVTGRSIVAKADQGPALTAFETRHFKKPRLGEQMAFEVNVVAESLDGMERGFGGADPTIQAPPNCAAIGPASALRGEADVAAGEPYFSDQPDADAECFLAKTEMRDKVDIF